MAAGPGPGPWPPVWRPAGWIIGNIYSGTESSRVNGVITVAAMVYSDRDPGRYGRPGPAVPRNVIQMQVDWREGKHATNK